MYVGEMSEREDVGDPDEKVTNGMVCRSLERLNAAVSEKLAENRHKGGWSSAPISALAHRLREEVLEELLPEVVHLEFQTETRADRIRALQRLRREAADAGAFSMMIVDRCVDELSKLGVKV